MAMIAPEWREAPALDAAGLLPKLKPKAWTERPRLWKVILLDDDFTPRDFVTGVLRGVFRMTDGEAPGVMPTVHRRGACVAAALTREVAEEKARAATDKGRAEGHPLAFATERE